MSPKPHISPALFALRGWVTAASITLAICALVQVVIFAVVRYTDARTSQLLPPPNTMIVVTRDRPAGASATVAASRDQTTQQADANRVRSVTDYNLQLTSSTICAAGLVAAITLTLMTGLGVLVAAGGGVPGVAYAVRAFVWSAVCMSISFPWSGFVGKTMVAGVFCGYETLTTAATSGGGIALVSHVFIPLTVLVVSGCITLWYRRGTAAGVILTSLSEVDEALEREMSIIRERGVGRLNPGARASGVMNQTLAPDRIAIPEPTARRNMAQAETASDDDVAPSMLRKKGGAPSRPI